MEPEIAMSPGETGNSAPLQLNREAANRVLTEIAAGQPLVAEARRMIQESVHGFFCQGGDALFTAPSGRKNLTHENGRDVLVVGWSRGRLMFAYIY